MKIYRHAHLLNKRTCRIVPRGFMESHAGPKKHVQEDKKNVRPDRAPGGGELFSSSQSFPPTSNDSNNKCDLIVAAHNRPIMMIGPSRSLLIVYQVAPICTPSFSFICGVGKM